MEYASIVYGWIPAQHQIASDAGVFGIVPSERDRVVRDRAAESLWFRPAVSPAGTGRRQAKQV